MRYCYELRRRVIEYAEESGSVSKASERYGVARKTIYEWRKKGLEGLKSYKKPGGRGGRRIDDEALRERVKSNNELLQKELAEEFKVHASTIQRSLKRLGISRKKNMDVRGEMLE